MQAEVVDCVRWLDVKTSFAKTNSAKHFRFKWLRDSCLSELSELRASTALLCHKKQPKSTDCLLRTTSGKNPGSRAPRRQSLVLHAGTFVKMRGMNRRTLLRAAPLSLLLPSSIVDAMEREFLKPPGER